MTQDLLTVVDASDTALAPSREVSMFERLALDPSVDVAKLEKLIEMQERIMRHNAKAAFNAAFAKMQPTIPEIDEKGKILVKGSLRSTYATLEDIHAAIKPTLAKHGFAVRHRTEWPKDGIIRVVGILSHEQGHAEESVFEAPMDRSEYRTDIQSMGSTVSYGRRYTTLDLLNIATRQQDNDGATAGRQQPPDGYIDWLDDLRSCASDGAKVFGAAFTKSKPEFKAYALKHDKSTLDALKVQAQRVQA
jgi:hypothetical protein